MNKKLFMLIPFLFVSLPISAQLNVDDITPPDVNSPEDKIILENSTGNYITWIVGDENPGTYVVVKDYRFYSSPNNWTNGSINVPLIGLVVGIYNFEIRVNDSSGNINKDSVNISVIYETHPNINSPSDIIISEGTVGNVIAWTIYDKYPGIYNITKNGSLYISDDTWSSGILVIHVDGLKKGTYFFTLTIYNLYNYSVSDTVIVSVIDVTIPRVSSPFNIEIVEGSINNSIIWSVTDSHSGMYNVTKNGTIYIQNTSWSNGLIIVHIDGLDKGMYIFVISIYDESWNYVINSVIVTVIDITPPVVSSSSLIKFTKGTVDYIVWGVIDKHPGFYNVLKDGSLYIANTAWISDSISVPIIGLAPNAYSFIITIYDDSGNFIVDTVLVAVMEDTKIILTTEIPTSQILFLFVFLPIIAIALYRRKNS